jgi:hypothetical protein
MYPEQTRNQVNLNAQKGENVYMKQMSHKRREVNMQSVYWRIQRLVSHFPTQRVSSSDFSSQLQLVWKLDFRSKGLCCAIHSLLEACIAFSIEDAYSFQLNPTPETNFG